LIRKYFAPSGPNNLGRLCLKPNNQKLFTVCLPGKMQYLVRSKKNYANMMNSKIYFLAIIVCMSCKKETAPVDTCTVSEATVAGTYLKTAEKYKSNSSSPEIDNYTFETSCKKDNLYELKNDGSVVVDEGADTCPGPPPPGGISAWSLSADKKTMALDAFYTIISFDCKTIVLQEKDFLIAGDTRTVTFVKQ